MLETQNYPGIPGIPGEFLEELTLFQKMLDPKLPRNSWHSWWIPGGIDTCSKILRDSNYPGIPGVQ
jgi:hypothetical protein